LLAAAPITSASVLFCGSDKNLAARLARISQQRSGFKKRSAKRAISVRTALFLFCRFFVFPYRFLIFFVFVLFEG
jgi:hypothetical protein